MTEHIWSSGQFDEMSWYDNCVHAIRIEEGEHGEGRLVLDIDDILEWLKGPGEGFRFRIVPAVLIFTDVTDPRISLDYAGSSAALTPFSL